MFIIAHGFQILSLLDSGSEVTLLRQSYCEQHLLPKIKLAISEKADAHTLFILTVTHDGQLPIKMYTELDIIYLGLNVPNVGMMIIDNPSQVLDKKQQSKLSGIIGWNLVCLFYNVFVKNTGHQDFYSFTCLEGVNPPLFSKLCVYHQSDTCEGNALGVTTKLNE